MTLLASNPSLVAQALLPVLLGTSSLVLGGLPFAPFAKGGIFLFSSLFHVALAFMPALFPLSVIPTGAARFFPPRRFLARRAAQWRDRGNTSSLSPSMEQSRSLNLVWRPN